MLLAVLVFRSFYGSSEPGTTFHNDSIPSNPLRPLFLFYRSGPMNWFSASSEPLVQVRAERVNNLFHPLQLKETHIHALVDQTGAEYTICFSRITATCSGLVRSRGKQPAGER